jgi:hypothetical protein
MSARTTLLVLLQALTISAQVGSTLFLTASSASSSASAASASSTGSPAAVVSFYLPGFDPQPLVASVVAADATATTLRFECAPGTDDSECGIPGPADVTKRIGATGSGSLATTEYDGAYSDSYETVTWSCAVNSQSADCVVTAEASYSGSSSSGVMSTVDSSLTFLPITVTAGQDKLAAASTASGSGGTTGSGTKSSATSAGGSASGSASGNAAPTAGLAGGVLVGAMGAVALLI